MMRCAVLSMVLALACCSAAPPPAEVPEPVIEVTPVPAPKPAVSPPVASVARQYDQAAKREIRAVTQPDVTPDYVQSVHQADLSARAALTTLEHHPSQAAVGNARTAVERLDSLLEQHP